MAMPHFLDSPCIDKADLCMGCEQAVKRNERSGRWYITIGHPGFNTAANNGAGYKSKDMAVHVVFYYAGRSKQLGL